MKNRPNCGRTPSSGKKFSVTGTPVSRSGSPVAGQAHVSNTVEGRESGHARERLALALQVEQAGDLHGLVGQVVGRAVGDPDEPRRVLEWQRPQPDGVDDAEDGDAGADAESDDQDGERREPEVTAKGAAARSGNPAAACRRAAALASRGAPREAASAPPSSTRAARRACSGVIPGASAVPRASTGACPVSWRKSRSSASRRTNARTRAAMRRSSVNISSSRIPVPARGPSRRRSAPSWPSPREAVSGPSPRSCRTSPSGCCRRRPTRR